ncbi:7SK snRNA methylphosphate capping enzyme-like [Planococcus citri]|uniref:7SK snRNA methylphosphate capping enzyme-like n=1 Tax=Planococcus citri TaxID=170843 RepID=UPI0031FA2C50
MSCTSSNRKRTHSFSNCGNVATTAAAGNALPGAGAGAAAMAAAAAKKKRKTMYKRGTATFVPPTKFLLGGNIRDPLNLGGLQEADEEVRSDVSDNDQPVQVIDEFLLGGDINDPLNLKSIVEPEVVDDQLLAGPSPPVAAAAAVDADSSSTAECAPDTDTPQIEAQRVDVDIAEAAVPPVPAVACTSQADPGPEDQTESQKLDKCVVNGATKLNASTLQHLNLSTEIPRLSAAGFGIVGRKVDRKDKIVSPVIPQPYRPLKSFPFRQIITPDLGRKVQKTPKFVEKNTRFQYGNYNRYYGYRNTNNGIDLRLEIFEKHRELFANKDVLDIGCNVGHVSLIVARSFGARSVTGIDIDRYLVDVAKKNVQHYINCPSPYSMESPSTTPSATNKKLLDLKYKCYPVSMPIMYGPICDANELRRNSNSNSASPRGSAVETASCREFPKNVRFVHANYVPESASMLQSEQPQYDTILCLSVTKWIHLNWADQGLKLAFKKMYAQLKPGGILVLEPQSWDSYKRKKTLTETIWRNYQNISLFPHHFDRYLMSSEVGFSRCQTLAVVNHHHKGFRRAIKVFRKSTGVQPPKQQPPSTRLLPPKTTS